MSAASYTSIIQEYINQQYKHPKNWANRCDGCNPFIKPPPPCPPPCLPCLPPCLPPCPPPCPVPCGEVCCKKKCCKKKKCSKKRKCCTKKDCLTVVTDDPRNPCERQCITINTCPCPPICCPLPPPPRIPCDPCEKPWAEFWPWSVSSWYTPLGVQP